MTPGPKRRAKSVLFILSCILTGVFPSSASAAMIAGTPGPLPSCAASEAGFDSRQAAQVKTFADGGELYTYEQGGRRTIFPQPPPNFDPLTASDEMLERYAFAPRPPQSEPEQLALWEEQMSTYREMSPPVGCTGAPPPKTGITGEVRHTGTEGTYNWAGYVTSAPGNQYQWNDAWADFTQVNGAAHFSCKSNAILSSWVGLGADATYSGLIQAGTDAFTNGTTAQWIEYWAGNWHQATYFPEMYVYPGDYIGLNISYSVSTETATFEVYDQNTGVFRSVVIPGLGLQFYDGSTGDFIDERPAGEAGYYPLLNFGQHQMLFAQVRNASGHWAWLGETNNLREQMWSGGEINLGKLLARAVGLDSVNSFTDKYSACQ